MYLQKSLPSDWESESKLSMDLERKAKSKRTAPRQDKDGSTSIQLSILERSPEPYFSKDRLAHTLKNLSLKDRLSFLSLVTPLRKSSENLGKDSISSAKNFLPFWNDATTAISNYLVQA